jgi:hypothetical protein
MQVSGLQSGSTGSTATTAASQTKSVAYYDPKDTNQDGVVSFAEELAYSLKHLDTQTSTAASSSSMSQYGQSGALSASGQTMNSAVDTYV